MIVNKSGVERIFCDYCDKWIENTDEIIIVTTSKGQEHYCCKRHHFDKKDNL